MHADFNPSADDIDFLEEKLLEHNCLQVDDYAYEHFMVKSVDDAGAMVAGLHGELGGGWLYIAHLWIDAGHRGQGLGQKLLAQAEAIAVERQCIGIYLYTYSFQSPAFYEKQGYHVFGAIDPFFDDHAKLYMQKRLVSSA
jgi:ribosomal protein S18 acetylase RimI-like enzyme